MVSIIVPVYNVEKYISKSINSIINQTYSEIEIILVDDGSTDKSSLLCDEYANLDSRIKVIHKINGGLSDARNAGLELASGEYIVFIDGDDYIDSKYIEIMYNVINESKLDMVVCNYQKVNENGSIIDKNVKEVFEAVKKVIYINELQYWNNMYRFDNTYYVVSWNKMYRKDVLSNISFPKGEIHEDERVIHLILNNCNKIACIKNELYFYVQRENSIMSNKISIKNLSYVDSIINRINYLINKGINKYIGYFFTTAVVKMIEFKKENIYIDYETRQKYRRYRKKMKIVSKDILFSKKQYISTRLKMIIYLIGGEKVYSITLKIYRGKTDK